MPPTMLKSVRLSSISLPFVSSSSAFASVQFLDLLQSKNFPTKKRFRQKWQEGPIGQGHLRRNTRMLHFFSPLYFRHFYCVICEKRQKIPLILDVKMLNGHILNVGVLVKSFGFLVCVDAAGFQSRIYIHTPPFPGSRSGTGRHAACVWIRELPASQPGSHHLDSR